MYGEGFDFHFGEDVTNSEAIVDPFDSAPAFIGSFGVAIRAGLAALELTRPIFEANSICVFFADILDSAFAS
jgi:hypothetical protein